MKTFSGKPILQDPLELQGFLDFLKEKEIKTYLEIGVARGDTFHAVVSQMPKGSRAVAVDYPEKSWGISESQMDLENAAKDLRDKGYDITIIYGDSKDPATIAKAITATLNGQEVNAWYDAILIDGDHTWNGVVSDYMNYSSFGQYIAFHDTINDMRTNRRGETINVPHFWELLKFIGNFEFAEFHTQNSNYGIGVIWKSSH